MSAICAIFNRTGDPVHPEPMNAMTAALEAYGPDGGQTWRQGSVGLGHRMLHITPESMNEALPFHDQAAGLAITADARLDNRTELCAALDVPHVQRHDVTDSQLLLRAYEKWGVDCPVHLLGDFAFAIWDERKRRLFCARDHLGIKPFYYYQASDLFVGATSIKAVLAIPGVPARLDPAYLLAYLSERHYIHPRLTFYESLRKLPPGHCLTVSESRFNLRAYWSAAESSRIRYQTEEEYVGRLRELLHQAVAARLRSAYRVGAHLSGGLDSSSVAVVASRLLRERGHPLPVYSWAGPPQPEDFPLNDERQYVEMVARQEGLTVRYCQAGAQYLAEIYQRDVTREPTLGGWQELAVRQLAQTENVRVLLSGWGGDELVTFNGRGIFAELFLTGRWVRLVRELRGQAAIHGGQWWKGLYLRVAIPMLPDVILELLDLDHHRREQLRDAYPTYLDRDFIRQYKAAPHVRRPTLRERPGAHRQQLRLLAHGYLAARIEAWADQGAHSGVEYRYPLLDKRLVEFSLGIPSGLCFRHGWKRYLFRQSMEGILPEEVRWHKIKDVPAVGEANETVVKETLEALRTEMIEKVARRSQWSMIDVAELRRQVSRLSETNGDPWVGQGIMKALWLLASTGNSTWPNMSDS